jgi:molybdenum cofactor cytidylyltransferase
MISAVVLAAGLATRFGRTKQLETIRGKPLVQHAVDTAVEAGLDEVVVVLGHDAAAIAAALRLPSTGRTVMNHAFASGIASSLSEGLRSLDAGSTAAVVLLADQPGIGAGHVRALVEAFEHRRSPIVRLRFRSGPGPALLERSTWPEAEALEGDEGARVLMERHPEWVEDIEVGGEAPIDVDEPGDLDRA